MNLKLENCSANFTAISRTLYKPSNLRLSEVCEGIRRSQMYDAFAGKKLPLLQTFPLMWSVHVAVLL